MFYKLEKNIYNNDLMYVDDKNFIYNKEISNSGIRRVVRLFRDQGEILKTTFEKSMSQVRHFTGDPTVQVSWEGSKITGWDFTPPTSTAPKPDDGNGGGNGGGNDTVSSRLIINTDGPDIALATDGALGAAELQKSNDLRNWRRLGDVPAEASEVLVTPRERGNEFYRLKKK